MAKIWRVSVEGEVVKKGEFAKGAILREGGRWNPKTKPSYDGLDTPEKWEELKVLLRLSGVESEGNIWQGVFTEIAEAASAAVAMYCLYIVLGYSEVGAYQTVYSVKLKSVPKEYLEYVQPFIATILVRFMPSRLRLMANITAIIENERIDASVRSNMIQFMAKYLFAEPTTKSAIKERLKSDEGVQEFVQSRIMSRGGILFIPPEPEVIDN